MGSQELGGNGSTYGKHMTLTERTGCVLDATGNLKLGVTGGGRTPLTKLSKFVEGKLADKGKL